MGHTNEATMIEVLVRLCLDYGNRHFSHVSPRPDEDSIRQYVQGLLYEGVQAIVPSLTGGLIDTTEAVNLLLLKVHDYFRVHRGGGGSMSDSFTDGDVQTAQLAIAQLLSLRAE